VNSRLSPASGPQIRRRILLRNALVAAAGLTTAALIGCGGDEEDSPSATPEGTAEAASSTPDRPFPHTIPATDKTPKRGGTLVLSKGQDVGPFDPTKTGATGSLTHTGTSYDTLLRRKMTTDESELRGSGSPAGDIEGALAQTWETTPDGLTYTFRVRPNIKWHNVPPLDGRPFVTEDVKRAYERYATTGVWQSNFEAVGRSEAPDATTLKVTLKRPSPDFIVPLAEQNNAIFPMELVDNGTIDRMIVGTGPMIFREAQVGGFVRFERNPGYWGDQPYLDGLEYRIIVDAAARVAAFRADQSGTEAVSNLRDVDAIRGSTPGIQVIQGLLAKSVFFTAFNMTNPKWKDERVRQAFSLALDRDAINSTLYAGLSSTLPVMPWIHVFDHVPTYEAGELGKWWRTDVAEAKQLLQAAGAENLTVDYPYFPGYLSAQNEILPVHMRQAGITLNLQQMDYTAFNGMLAGVNYPDTIQAWDPHGTQADNYFKAQLKSDSTGNWFTIRDPQLDTWADEQSVELDPEARRELLRKMWDRVLDKAYRVELPNNVSFTMFQPWLHGMQWILGNDGLGPSTFGYNNSQFIGNVWIDK
jgi:peptide/nickel transport system substrate-binding protein